MSSSRPTAVYLITCLNIREETGSKMDYCSARQDRRNLIALEDIEGEQKRASVWSAVSLLPLSTIQVVQKRRQAGRTPNASQGSTGREIHSPPASNLNFRKICVYPCSSVVRIH